MPVTLMLPFVSTLAFYPADNRERAWEGRGVAGRAGVMPRWNNRLDPVTIRMLAAYVHSLGGGESEARPVRSAASGR